MTGKDVEIGIRAYKTQTSSEPEGDHEATCDASILKLLLASLPRLALRMVATAQWLAIRPTHEARLISILGPLVSILVTPIIGALTDRCTHNWGRRRPFLFGAMLASVALLCLMRLVQGSTAVSVVLYVLMTVAVNTVEIPLALLVSDLAGNRQAMGAALGEGWATVGSAVTVAYLELLGSYSSMDIFIALAMVSMIISVGVVVYFIKETQVQDYQPPATGVFGSISTAVSSAPRVLAVFAFISLCVTYGMATYANNKTEFFETEIEQTSTSSESALSSTTVYLIHQACIYVYTWVLPFLTNKIGVNNVLAIALVPQALLVVMAFIKTKTGVAVIDLAATVFESTALMLVVSVVVHVYGLRTSIGVHVGLMNSIGSVGLLLCNAVGAKIVQTSVGFQLPVLVAGVVGAVGLLISMVVLKLRMKSL